MLDVVCREDFKKKVISSCDAKSQEGRRYLVEEDLPGDKNTRQEKTASSCDAEKPGKEEIKEVCLVSSLIQSVSSEVFLFFIAHFAFLRCSFNEGLFKRGIESFLPCGR